MFGRATNGKFFTDHNIRTLAGLSNLTVCATHSAAFMRKADVFTLLQGVIYLVPLFLILPSLWHGKGTWAAIPASEILTFITICITYAVSRRGNNA